MTAEHSREPDAHEPQRRLVFATLRGIGQASPFDHLCVALALLVAIVLAWVLFWTGVIADGEIQSHFKSWPRALTFVLPGSALLCFGRWAVSRSMKAVREGPWLLIEGRMLIRRSPLWRTRTIPLGAVAQIGVVQVATRPVAIFVVAPPRLLLIRETFAEPTASVSARIARETRAAHSAVGFRDLPLLWKRARNLPRDHCRKCGYSMQGLVTGRCPECGDFA